MSKIRTEQRLCSTPHGLSKDDEGIWKKGAIIWIFKDAQQVKIEITVAAHCGTGELRDAKVTEEKIKSAFRWNNFALDVKDFVRSFLHCNATRAGEKTPRLLKTLLHVSRPNEAAHTEFLYMWKSRPDNGKYFLLYKDSLSGYAWLTACSAVGSDKAAQAIG